LAGILAVLPATPKAPENVPLGHIMPALADADFNTAKRKDD
jgi:hypothetical protein